MNNKTCIVHFIASVSGTSFKTGEYKTKKAIRRAQEKYELQYGAILSLVIIDKATMNPVALFEVA